MLVAGCGVFLNLIQHSSSYYWFNILSFSHLIRPSCPLLQEFGVGRGKRRQTDSLAEPSSPHSTEKSLLGMILKGWEAEIHYQPESQLMWMVSWQHQYPISFTLWNLAQKIPTICLFPQIQTHTFMQETGHQLERVQSPPQWVLSQQCPGQRSGL